MSDRFKNKYRIKSKRLKDWDYGRNAAYFVTICTKDKVCFFGEAIDGKMILNDTGQIAQDCWLAISGKFPFVKLGNHVIMPNHVHGIIIIDKPVDARDINDNDITNDIDFSVDDTVPAVPAAVETRLIASLPVDTIDNARDNSGTVDNAPHENATSGTTNENKIPGGITGNKNPMLHDNLSKIIRWYKGRTTFESRKIRKDFAWQPLFHDHIIRNKTSFQQISNYITNNPINWTDDRFFA